MDGKPLQILTEQHGRQVNIAPQFDTNVNIFEAQANSFVSACRGEAPPAATAEQGVTLMRVLDAIYASSESNKEIAIPA